MASPNKLSCTHMQIGDAVRRTIETKWQGRVGGGYESVN